MPVTETYSGGQCMTYPFCFCLCKRTPAIEWVGLACETVRVRCAQTKDHGECNGSGSCMHGYCLCKPGFSGVACQVRLDESFDKERVALKQARRCGAP